MEGLDAFAKIAPHLANPLVLVGFALLLSFGIHRTLIKSGLLKPPSAKDSGVIVRALLRYGFIVALTIILAGFAYAAWKTHVEARPEVNVDDIVDAIVDTYRDRIRERTEREEAYQEQIRQLTAAVTALAQRAEQPNAPPGVKEALEQLAEGNPRAAEEIFAETLERRTAEGQAKEAAEAARHFDALAFLHDQLGQCYNEEAVISLVSKLQRIKEEYDKGHTDIFSLQNGRRTLLNELYNFMTRGSGTEDCVAHELELVRLLYDQSFIDVIQWGDIRDRLWKALNDLLLKSASVEDLQQAFALNKRLYDQGAITVFQFNDTSKALTKKTLSQE